MPAPASLLTLRPVVIALLPLLLAACGGGSNDTGTPAAVTQPASITPTRLTVTSSDGLQNEPTAEVSLSENLADVVYVQIQPDQAGIFTSKTGFEGSGPSSGRAYFQVHPSLVPGRYTGTATVKICKDAPCTAQYAGSPFALQYDISIAAPDAGTLTPLPASAGFADWETYQGNAAHTGYVPVTLDPTRFSKRWTWKTPQAWSYLNDVSIVGQKVFVSSGIPLPQSPRNSVRSYLAEGAVFALDENDGTNIWKTTFGSTVGTYPAAASGSSVYVVTPSQSNSTLYSLNAQTGAVNFATGIGELYNKGMASTLKNGVVYSHGGNGGTIAVDATTGQTRWASSTGNIDSTTPAVDDRYVYSYFSRGYGNPIAGQFSVFNVASGSTAWTLPNTTSQRPGQPLGIAPVIAGPDSGRVNAFNLF